MINEVWKDMTCLRDMNKSIDVTNFRIKCWIEG